MLRFATALAAAAVLSPGQNLIVDGDLEGHTAGPGCTYNNSIPVFNGYFANVHSFGAWSGIDIMANGGGCFGIAPHSGITKLTLAYNNVTNGDKDEMALDLVAPLNAGAFYALTFWAEDMAFGPGGQPFEIGVSTVNNNFGVQIFTASATLGVWTCYSLVFQAPIAATHLTVRCPPGLDMWVSFDDFQLTQPLLATSTPLGAACSGPVLLTPLTNPVMGTNWDLQLSGLPTSALGFLSFGFSDPNVPLPPPFVPGCIQRTSAITSVLVLPPWPAFSVAIPCAPAFRGLPLFVQGGGLSPPIAVASNGLRGRIGDL